jgi:tRNA nucleotidyltransferase (CCA-adding enzyme)
MIPLPPSLDPVLKLLYVHNITPIIVGGYVRDALLGIESKDIDIELYGVPSLENLENLLKPFGKLGVYGKSFGVLKLKIDDLDIDFSPPRTEAKNGFGHTGFRVEFAHNLDFEGASARRDFTINSIGYDPKSNTLLDPHGGVDDLRNKTLRYVSAQTFADDPLRVLRAVQFAGRFELTCDNNLLVLCADMIAHGALTQLPKERIFEELKKLLMLSRKPSLGLRVLDSMGGRKLLGGLADTQWERALVQCERIALTRNGEQRHDLPLLFASLLLDVQQPKEILERICFHGWLIRSTLEIINFAKKTKRIEFPPKPLVQGRDLISLGFLPSQDFAMILKEVYEAQIKGDFCKHDEAIVWLKSRLVITL